MRRSKPRLDMLERRILLSAYGFSGLGTFGLNATGASPQSSLVADSNGNLFGTAAFGGAYGQGTVFEVPSGSNAIVALASFNGPDGAQPAGGLALDAAGDVFGTTYRGGANSKGTAFELARGSNAITTLAVFNGANGSQPEGGVALDASGNLYGATSTGGANNVGTIASTSFGAVWELVRGSNAIATFASFNNTTGSEPQGGLTMDASGNLYGTTYRGGAYRSGTVFEIASGSTAITTLASFDLPTGGQSIAAPAVDAQGNVFGTTVNGGARGHGTVFEVARGSHAVVTLAAFDGTNGSEPLATVTLDPSGNVRGLTYLGGTGGDGTLFEVARGSKAIAVLASFDGTNGVFPNSALVPDGSGNLYGTTALGGAYDQGTIFEIAADTHAVTTLVSFDGSDGDHPLGGLTVDSAGNLYGTTSGGGSGLALGTVFELPHGSNAIKTLASFNDATGGNPRGGVTLDAAGDLFGTTLGSYSNYNGTVFEIANGSATITTLAAFNGYNGSTPEGNLAVDTSGNLYGTTQGGGSGGAGTVFEIIRGSSSITTLAAFNGTNGEYPQAGVILDPAGNLYGTATEGTDNDGAVFEIAAGSTSLTTLATFDAALGAGPGALVRDRAGNLYGTTTTGGPGRQGTVFEIEKGTTSITTLMSFDGTNGGHPDAIALDDLGNLYGTTAAFGGKGNAGTAFELAANTTLTLTLTHGSNPAVAHQPVMFTAILSGGVPDGQTVTLLDASNNDAVVATGTTAGGSATLDIPPGALAAGTHNLIAVYGGDLTHAASASKPVLLTVLPPFFRPSRRI